MISCAQSTPRPLMWTQVKNFNLQYIYPISFKISKKGKPCEMDLPLLKNDITGSEPTVKILDSRTHNY